MVAITTTQPNDTHMAATGQHVLRDVVAWLVVNSMRSEQLQWSMLCIQNVANIYRKNAFQQLVTDVSVGKDHQVHPSSLRQGTLSMLMGEAADAQQGAQQGAESKEEGICRIFSALMLT